MVKRLKRTSKRKAETRICLPLQFPHSTAHLRVTTPPRARTSHRPNYATYRLGRLVHRRGDLDGRPAGLSPKGWGIALPSRRDRDRSHRRPGSPFQLERQADKSKFVALIVSQLLQEEVFYDIDAMTYEQDHMTGQRYIEIGID